MGTRIKDFFLLCLGRSPYISGLAQASGHTFAEAAKELVFVWSLSLLPIILSSFIDAGRSSDPLGLDPFWVALKNNVKSGEIFIYSNALLAPIGFILYKHNRDCASFPNHISFTWTLLFAIPISAVIFAMQRCSVITNISLINRIAVGIFFLSLALRYLSLIYDALRVDYVAMQKQEENDLSASVAGFAKGDR